ncbi:ABC transporter substrate-binding protein [Aquihabitans daechungensis]|uniref:ABC transporter substrate-binding protein n=1 Tax=Aquihabitans daechungensis TaxID=1052257 RepID=UPI003BA0D63B
MKKLVGLLAVLALTVVVASCGDRGSDSSGGTENGSTTTPNDEGGGAGDWGDLQGVCGPNEGGGKVAAEDAQGVSEDEIVLGTVADPGFSARPGLNQEIFDAGDAFVAWCNEAGGINGKKLTLNKHDAKLTDYKPAIEEACTTDFAMVGGGAVQDNLWADTGAACDLIDVAGFAVTPEKAGLAGQTPAETRTVQVIPNPGDRYIVAGLKLIDEEYPGALDNTGFLTADFQTLAAQYSKESQGFEAEGATEVYKSTYGINGEANWKPFVTDMKNKGVTFQKFIGEGSNAAAFETARRQVGFEPEVRFYETNFYDQEFIKAAGTAADGALISSVFIPMEEADSHPATQQYLDVMEEQGGKKALLGMQSTSAWLLFATLAKACDQDDDLTRSCILKGAEGVTEWTGGGLHAPTNPAENDPATCQMVMEIKDQKFTRWGPADEDFACPDGAVVEVEPA